ncbi:hypothetical protein J6590_080302 [Homalodisca vitripennis]|nr:hypothetical protein J6590_080302 [Homalodisca vitripennis]
MNEKQKRIEASVEVTLVETVADTKKHGQSFSAAAGVDADTDPHTDAQSFFRISLWLTQLIAKGNKLSIVAVTEGKGQTRPSPNRLVEVVKRQRTGPCSGRFFRIVLPVPGPASPDLYGVEGGRWWGPNNYLFRCRPKLNAVLRTSEILPVPVNRSRPSHPSNGGGAPELVPPGHSTPSLLTSF